MSRVVETLDKVLPKHWKRTSALLATGAVLATAVSANHVQDNDEKVSTAGDTAMGLALGRGACKLTSAKESTIKGKRMLSFGMELDSRFDPGDIESNQYGGAFMGVAFRDNPDKYGVTINHVTQAKTPTKHVAQPKPPLKQAVVKGTNSSFEGVDTAIITAPVSLTSETYEVSRFVGVTAEATGKFVRDTTVDAIAQISCGTFVYHQGTQPVLQ